MEPLQAQGESPGYAEPFDYHNPLLVNDDCVAHSLTCVSCGNPTNMADFAPGTATCKTCAAELAQEKRLNDVLSGGSEP